MELKDYTDAMKVDILKLFEKPDLGVYELRRIQNIAKTMVDFVNSANTLYEKEGTAAAMRETADGVAPTLHEALLGRTFDGEDALKDVYVALLEQFAGYREATEETQDMYKRMGLAGRPGLADQLGLPRFKDLVSKMKRLGADAAVDDVKKLGAGAVDPEGDGDVVDTAFKALDVLPDDKDEDEDEDAGPIV